MEENDSALETATGGDMNTSEEEPNQQSRSIRPVLPPIQSSGSADNNASSFAADTAAEDELQIIKAKSMYNMIEKFNIKESEKRLLFLTNKQAGVFNESNIHTLIEAFELPKPQLVIKLMNSKHGVPYERWYQTLNIPVKRTALFDFKHSREIEREMILFMQDFLIPMAAANHAIIFVRLPPGCTLLACLKAALSGTRSRYGKRLPFTVIGIDTELQFHRSARDEPGYPTNVDAGYTAAVRRHSVNWTKNFARLDEFYDTLVVKKYGANSTSGKAWLPSDVDNLIIVDGLDDNTGGDLQLNFETAAKLEWLILKHFSRTLPSIALQADRSSSPCTPFLESGVPVIYLDNRSRPPIDTMIMEERLSSAMTHFKQHINDVMALTVAATTDLPSKSPAATADGILEGSMTPAASSVVTQDTVPMEAFNSCSIAYFHNILYGSRNSSAVGNSHRKKRKDDNSQARTSLFTAIEDSNGLSPDPAAELTNSSDMSARPETSSPVAVGQVGRPTAAQIKAVVDLIVRSDLIFLAHHYDISMEDLARKWDDEDWSLLKMCNYELEEYTQEQWRETYAALTHPKFSHGHIIDDVNDLKNTVEKLLLSDRLPLENPVAGLLLLREAWDTVDICSYSAHRYKLIAKILYLLFLAIGITTTALTALRNEDYFMCRRCPLTNSVSLVDGVIFILAVSASIISSAMAFVNPNERWRVLRGSSQRMESAIWQYRARVGAYELKSQGSLTSPEKTLRDRIAEIRNSIQETGAMAMTDFSAVYPASVYTHGQYTEVVEPGQSDANWWRNLSHSLSLCCRTDNAPQVHPYGAPQTARDDFHSPQDPESYITLRTQPLISFYKARLPPNSRFYGSLQTVLILATAVGAALTFFSLTEYVGIMAVIATSVSAYMEFHSTGLKLSRYNGTVVSLQNLLLWWNSLSKLEKADTQNISKLVLTSEQIHTGELESWLSAPQKSVAETNDSRDATNSADKSNVDSASSALGAGGAEEMI